MATWRSLINNLFPIKALVSCIKRLYRAAAALSHVSAGPACLIMGAWPRARVVYIRPPMARAPCGRSHFNFIASHWAVAVADSWRWSPPAECFTEIIHGLLLPRIP